MEITTRATLLPAEPSRFGILDGGGASDLRFVGVAMAAGGLLLPFGPDLSVPLCPLRAVTGVPCPFCGMTTATIAAAHGDFAGSVAANPAAVLLIAAVAIAFVPAIYRGAAFRSGARRFRPFLTRLPWVMLPFLWAWQLDRFGFL